VAHELPIGISLTPVFDAPRGLVCREWTEPERFADWFGGPDCEVPLKTIAMDVRPGGAWRAIMFAPPNRREIHWNGDYQEVVEPERLVFTVSDQPGEDRYEVVTVVLSDLGDGRTEMHFEQRGHLSPGAVRLHRAWLGHVLSPARRAASRAAELASRAAPAR
jgi:uncharacterized protein YndB with AHSA1/START domain